MTKATVGVLSICCLSSVIAISKPYFFDAFKDVQGLREVSPRTIFPQPTLKKRNLVDAQVQFGFKLFSTLTESQEEENILISPTSIALTLSMLYNGATGTTQREIAEGLNLRNVSGNTLNRANRTLYDDLNNHEVSSNLIFNNFLWAREGFSFRYHFHKNSRSYYRAKITNLDFSSSEARGIMNRSVREEIQATMNPVMGLTQADDVLFLTNTASFQGLWQMGFDRNLTKDKPFYLADKSIKNYPFMSRKGIYNYLETPQLKAVELPYGDGRFSLYLFLAKQENSLSNIVEEITAKKLTKLIYKFRRSHGLVELPRFRLNSEVDLTNSLKNLGFSTMFDSSKAEFSDLSSDATYINGIKHQAIITVNESGITNPSQDSSLIKTTSAKNQKEEFSLAINRPFLSIIRDNQTGNILFIGMIFEP
ncbi:serpin family protein [Crocosphaera sp. Alani8]|uniref:serpin family protein n=1 Tax=Crocosphaera sp. Alani8 TaxID=3038952 RepID=UPI00313B298D